MKTGIKSIGVYVPYYYISRDTMAKAWSSSGRGQKGVRSLINFDEDSVTMAVEAVDDCLRRSGKQEIGALYFASTTAPYMEKAHSGIVATACNLNRNLFTADFSNCTKAGTGALRSAIDACIAKTVEQAIVVASDCRDAYPKSSEEQLFGDAAASILVGNDNVIATIDDFATTTNEITDVWRNATDRFVNFAEERFLNQHGYMDEMSRVIKAVLSKAGLSAVQISKAVFTTSGMQNGNSLGKKLGFTPEQIQKAFMEEIGYCGTAQPFLMLGAALATSNPGDKILLAAYGNGADAYVLTVTEEIQSFKANFALQNWLDKREELDVYAPFLSYREELKAVPGAPYTVKASTAKEWREQNTFIKLLGSSCKKCGASIFPINRVCYNCGAKDEYETFRAPDRTAKIFTYSLDNYAGRSDFPLVGQIVADDSENARYYLMMTDFKKVDVKIGEKVEFAFRKIHNLGNYVNYYWKFRPIRSKGGNA